MTSGTQIVTAKHSKSVKLKKHSRTSPETQFKELNQKLRNILPDQQIN